MSSLLPATKLNPSHLGRNMAALSKPANRYVAAMVDQLGLTAHRQPRHLDSGYTAYRALKPAEAPHNQPSQVG